MLEKSKSTVRTFTVRDGKGGQKQRPLQNGQVLNLLAYITGVPTRDDGKEDETSGFLCLDGRLFDDYFILSSRTIDDSDLYRTPFDDDVFKNLPTGLRLFLQNCAQFGTNEALFEQAFKNLGVEWLPDFRHPRILQVRLNTTRTGGSRGLSRWYWFSDAVLQDEPDTTKITLTDADRVAFINRFGTRLTNPADFWESLDEDGRKRWTALLR
jgi:hypothetical protein